MNQIPDIDDIRDTDVAVLDDEGDLWLFRGGLFRQPRGVTGLEVTGPATRVYDTEYRRYWSEGVKTYVPLCFILEE